jgi:hypothetical protein
MQSANDFQVGGDHYRKVPGEQHWDRAVRLRLDFFQYMITKYIERCRDKNGKQDVEKAFHFCQKYLECFEQWYGTKPQPGSKATLEINVDASSALRSLDELVALADKLAQRLEPLTGALHGAASGADAHEAALDNARDVDWLLNNVVLTRDGKISLNGVTYNCLAGFPEQFTLEGGFGDGRNLWTCVACRAKLYTTGPVLPHAVHRCGEEKHVLHRATSQAGEGGGCSACGGKAVAGCFRDDCPHHVWEAATDNTAVRRFRINAAFIVCKDCRLLPTAENVAQCTSSTCPHKPAASSDVTAVQPVQPAAPAIAQT